MRMSREEFLHQFKTGANDGACWKVITGAVYIHHVGHMNFNKLDGNPSNSN